MWRFLRSLMVDGRPPLPEDIELEIVRPYAPPPILQSDPPPEPAASGDDEVASWVFTPKVEVVGAEVTATISAAPPALPENFGERHSRLWIQFLAGAIASIEDDIARGIGDLDEKRAQIADKKQQVAIHSAMHPDDSRDDDYLREHAESAKAAG